MLSAGYINALARIFQIKRSYIDLYGSTQIANNKQVLSVLKTIGLTKLETDEDAEEIIQHIKNERCKRRFKPVQVVYEGEKIKIDFYLEESEVTEAIFWKLTLENGELEVGELKTQDLPEKGFRNVVGKESTARYVKFEFVLNKQLPLGYHKFTLKIGADDLRDEAGTLLGQLIIIAPKQAYIPKTKRKYTGINAQLYSLRSKNNWGIGEFGDLKPLIDTLALQDGDFLGLSPIHAISINNLGAYSPYSPTSRRFLNVFNLNVEEIISYQGSSEELIKTPEIQSRIAGLRESKLIDYCGVKALKLEVFRELYHVFLAEHVLKKTELAHVFEEFAKRGGRQLECYATYEALCEYFLAQDETAYGWTSWGDEYKSPDCAAVQEFAMLHHREVDFYKYLQWHADRQLQNVTDYAQQKGLEIGFYIDCAISTDKNSADVWANKRLYAVSASIGCPPDAYAPQGQNWGFPPPKLHAMAEEQYRNFIETLRSNMKYGGAIRIDHALSLYRLFWIPDEAGADNGLYIHYPFEDLLGILCLESTRHKCIVVGEDLGTIPGGFREKMAERCILSYSVFFFMKRWDGSFENADAYKFLSYVTGTTHDMMTLWGFWKEIDLDERLKIGLLNEVTFKQEKENRKKEKQMLVKLLRETGFLPPEVEREDSVGATGDGRPHTTTISDGRPGTVAPTDDQQSLPLEIFEAIQNFLLSTPALLNAVPLEDLVAQEEQVNIPGVVDEYPCWKHKIPVNVEDVLEAARE